LTKHERFQHLKRSFSDPTAGPMLAVITGYSYFFFLCALTKTGSVDDAITRSGLQLFSSTRGELLQIN